MKKIILKIKKLLKKQDPNLVHVKFFMYDYFENGFDTDFIPSLSALQITNVKVKTLSTHVIVTVTTLKPGLFIGLKGRLINHFTKSLEQYLNRSVEIELLECKPFAP